MVVRKGALGGRGFVSRPLGASGDGHPAGRNAGSGYLAKWLMKRDGADRVSDREGTRIRASVTSETRSFPGIGLLGRNLQLYNCRLDEQSGSRPISWNLFTELGDWYQSRVN